MATRALDVTTIMKCLRELEESFLGQNREWKTENEGQQRIFAWYSRFKDLLPKVRGLKAKASRKYDELNDFLTAEGFEPMFDPFEGIGVASILDKLINWAGGTATLCEIYGRDQKTYPGFELPPDGVNIYQVSQGFLAELKTKSDDTLWLLLPKSGSTLSDLDMVQMAFDVMTENRRIAHMREGVQIPKLDFYVKPDLGFLLNASTTDLDGVLWYISQAFQMFKMRMNEKGARVKVATGIVMKSLSMGPSKLVFDQPFYGWWTQKGLEELPMAVFYADYDSWKEPAGSLEDL